MAKVLGIGHFSFTVLDMERTLRFYCGMLGGKLLTETIDEGDDLGRNCLGKMITNPYGKIKVAMVELGGVEIEFLQYLEPETITAYHRNPTIAGSAHIALHVDDIEELYQTLSAKGVEFHSAINDCYRHGELVWRWVYARDPDGICCEIVQLNRDSDYYRQTQEAK